MLFIILPISRIDLKITDIISLKHTYVNITFGKFYKLIYIFLCKHRHTNIATDHEYSSANTAHNKCEKALNKLRKAIEEFM